MSKKVAILTGEFGQGHLALARKLQSHLDPLPSVDCVDIININRLVDEAVVVNSFWDRMRYSAHHQLMFSYDNFAKLPAWLRYLHPINLASRWVKRFYAMIWGTASYLVYRKAELERLLQRFESYDCVFSVLATPNHLLWMLQRQLLLVNVSQDFGAGVRTVWWGRFWDFHLSSDSNNAFVARSEYHSATKVLELGPLYHRLDHLSLDALSSSHSETRILFIPGKTGNQSALLRRLLSIAKACLARGHHVVWRGSEAVINEELEHWDAFFQQRITVQGYGPLDDLEQFDLVVGKGSYNQITESLIKGVPFACVHFLGYWEKQNLCVQSIGVQLLDWSREYSIPQPEQLKKMRRVQLQLRDELFSRPDEVAQLLGQVVLSDKIVVPLSTPLPEPYLDFSGRRVASERTAFRRRVGIVIKKMLLLPLLCIIYYSTGWWRYLRLRKSRSFFSKEF